MAYSALPGYYGVDEEESEGTLGFWYLFQEALWEGDPEYDSDTSTPPSTNKREGEQMTVAKAVYSELAKVLQRKVTWPPSNVLQGWPRGKRPPGYCDPCLTPGKIRKTSSKREPKRMRSFEYTYNYGYRYRRDVGDTLLNA